MDWLLPVISAAIFWGIGQTFIKRGLSCVPPLVSNLFATFFALIIDIPFALIGGVRWEYFPLILVFGLLANFPSFIFPYIIEKTKISLTGTILASYPIFTVILAMVFLKETLNVFQAIGILTIIIGIFLVVSIKRERFKIETWLLWSILGAFLMGFGYFVGKFAIGRFDLYSFIMASTLANIPCMIVLSILDSRPIKLKGERGLLIYSILGNGMMPIGLLFLYIALSKGSASLVSPVSSIYPAITVLLAYLFLKERISKINFIGILTICLGIVLVSLKI